LFASFGFLLARIGNHLPVVPDVVEEIEHDLVNAGASEQGAVDRPIIGSISEGWRVPASC
jgi:hypothetical protein